MLNKLATGFHLFCLVAPAIIFEEIDQIKNEGDTVYFNCRAFGEPVPTINWLFNGIPVTNMDRYSMSQSSSQSNVGNSTLMILNVQSSDVGTYTCKAINVLASNESSGILTVNGK